MYQKSLIVLVSILITLPSLAQQERKDIREGNKLFKSEKFNESEVAYRKAMESDINSVPGTFNLGDALYRQEKFEDASTQFNQVISNNVDKITKAQAFHNLGNSLLQAGELDDAIEAYKNALRNVPNDIETKYNLAYAQNLKKQQQEQEQENQDQDQENKDQENQDQENKDQQNQDQQDQENKDQQNQDQQDQENEEQQDQQEQQQQQPQEGKISKEDAQRLLEALANDEKKVQDKVKKAKAKAQRVRVLKDW